MRKLSFIAFPVSLLDDLPDVKNIIDTPGWWGIHE
jgi:hypothetical protein